MTEYVALERRQLIDQLNETLRTETWAGDETNPNILSSALSVFLNVKKVFKRCSNLTTRSTLFAVHEVFLQLLSAYAKTLRERAQAACASAIDHRLPEAQRSSEIKTMCLIVQHLLVLLETIGPAGDSMIKSLDDGFKDKVDMMDVEDSFSATLRGAQ